MSSKKQRARTVASTDKEALVLQIEGLQAEIDRLSLHNAVLERDADESKNRAELYAETLKTVNRNNEFLRMEKLRLENRLESDHKEFDKTREHLNRVITNKTIYSAVIREHLQSTCILMGIVPDHPDVDLIKALGKRIAGDSRLTLETRLSLITIRDNAFTDPQYPQELRIHVAARTAIFNEASQALKKFPPLKGQETNILAQLAAGAEEQPQS